MKKKEVVTFSTHPFVSVEDMQKRIETEFKKAGTLLGLKQAFFFYGSANSIAKEAVRIAQNYLNLRLKAKDITRQIKAYTVSAFRLCPISCIQHPVVFFLFPYPSEMLPFLGHTVSHEMLHIKHALFHEPKMPYFAPKLDLSYWRRAGYSAFPYDEYFQDLIDSVGLPNVHKIVWDYCERVRDFLVNKELLSMPEYAQLTQRWEMNQAKSDVTILRDNSSVYSPYRKGIAFLDLGMRTALLNKNIRKEILEEVISIHSLKEDHLLRIRKIGEVFNNLYMPLKPSEMKKIIYTLDQLVSLLAIFLKRFDTLS